uniref:Odorant receptor n=1 Tax=Locusta migratoria TaxID=7004 RepID=A0A0M4IUI8_LOCMI|nr:odorant receptor 94 [Locusta migratoria]
MEALWWPVSPVRRGLRLLGLWVAPPGRRALHRLALSWVLASHAFLLLVGAASLVMDTPEDLPQLSFTAYTTLTCFGLIAKLVSFSLDGARLTRLLQLLAECRARFPDPGGRRGQHHLMAVRLHRFLQVSYRVNSVVWMFAPVVSAALAARSGGEEPVKRMYVLPLWLPVDTQASPAYEAVYVAQLATGWMLSETTVLLDVALLALMLHAAAELAVLNDRLRSQPAAAAAGPALASPVAYPKDGDTDPKHDHMYRHMVENIQHHQIIIVYTGLLQSVVRRAISVLLACNTVSICFHIIATVALLQKDIELVGMTKMVVGSTLYAYQTAILCLLGQRITTQSERLSASAYSSAWWEGDGRYQKLVVVFCERASGALSIRVCGLYSLSKETLLQVLKAAYSLFNFMYQAMETSNH